MNNILLWWLFNGYYPSHSCDNIYGRVFLSYSMYLKAPDNDEYIEVLLSLNIEYVS